MTTSINRRHLLALGIAAVFVMLGSQAQAAFAAPEYLVWPNHISAFDSKEVSIENAKASQTIKCTRSENEAQVLGFAQGSTTLVLHNCISSLLEKCNSTNTTTKGEIKTNGLTWRLVYISKKPVEVGMLFESSEAGGPWATISCGSVHKAVLRGSLLGGVSPLNAKAASFAIAVSGSKGVQSLTNYEGANGEALTANLEVSWNGQPYSGADMSLTSLAQEWSSEQEIRA